MPLTIQQIYERYSSVDFVRNIYVKRRIVDDTYEALYQDIKDLIPRNVNTADVVQGVSYAIPNDSTNFGVITAANATFVFENIYGEVSGEDFPASIFVGYLRHRSLIKIEDGYIDPESNTPVVTTSFEGLIDDTLCETSFDNQEKIVAIDLLTSKLKQYQKGDFSNFVGANLKDVIYELMNRSEFTNFFSVSLANINPGVNITVANFNTYEADTTFLEFIQNLSIGHSIAYLKNGVFYYSAIEAAPTVSINFLEQPERKINFRNYNSGGKRVYDKVYWDGTSLNYTLPDRIYNNQLTIDIKAVTDTTQRQTILNYLGIRFSQKRPWFELTIPYLPILFLLDRITIQRQGNIVPGSFQMDVSLMGVSTYFYRPIGAIIISGSDNWIIREIKHSQKLETVLTVEKIVV